MFLFGLVITLMFGWAMRWRILPLALGLVLMLHIAATTSIKTNLGVVLGAAAACFFYFAHFITLIRRNAVVLAVILGLIVYAMASNEAAIETFQEGFDRVVLGANVLIARDDRTGVTEFGARKSWGESGLSGWAENPLFGHGVEAFRDDFGVTSHSTPIDLLYNAGLIGFVLFYSIFVSIAWRLYEARNKRLGNLRALLLATLVCYAFMTLSGTMHYSSHLAVFIAFSSALLTPRRVRGLRGVPAAAAER
jgi:O-antigen ligase